MKLLHRNKLGLWLRGCCSCGDGGRRAGAGAAFAKAPPVPLATRRAECVSEINRRVNALDQAQAQIDHVEAPSLPAEVLDRRQHRVPW